jgi:hypothetical protein
MEGVRSKEKREAMKYLFFSRRFSPPASRVAHDYAGAPNFFAASFLGVTFFV